MHVMPDFIDFLFAFGYQESVRDPSFSGFRQRIRYSDERSNLRFSHPSLTETEIQLCYNLKSVEFVTSAQKEGSIRQCAVHHSLNLDNGRTSWLFVKGNCLIKRRIEKATSKRGVPAMSNFETPGRAFAAALATHLVLCEWSNEQWRWYLNDLEDESQQVCGRTLSAPLNVLSKSEVEHNEWLFSGKGSRTLISGDNAAISRSHDVGSRIFERGEKQTSGRTNISSQPLPPHIIMAGVATANPQRTDSWSSDASQDWSISQIQRIQYIQERIHEVKFTLQQNLQIMHQLKDFYQNRVDWTEFKIWDKALSPQQFKNFLFRLDCIKNDVQMHILRTELLSERLSQRKSLVS